MEIPEHIFNKIMLYLSHPIADILKERCNRLIEKIKDVLELTFHRVYFYTGTYPELLAYIKNEPTKQIREIYFETLEVSFFVKKTPDFRNK